MNTPPPVRAARDTSRIPLGDLVRRSAEEREKPDAVAFNSSI